MVKPTGEGLRAYYKSKIEDLEIEIRDRQHALQRMQAQRNDLNTKGAGGKVGLCACDEWARARRNSRCDAIFCLVSMQCVCCERSCSYCRSPGRMLAK